MSFPRYPKYKDSGVEWLGEVPEHWEVCKLRHLFEILKRIAGELGYDVFSITQNGIRVKDVESNEGQQAMDYSKYQLVQEGDFAMNPMDLITGGADIAAYTGVTSPDYRVCRLRNATDHHDRYLLYLFQNAYRRRLFYPYGQGSSQLGRWRFPRQQFNTFCFPLPPRGEQLQIAAFLDRETAKIDALIAEQQRLIELLQEKRQAVTSHAVTKGLNPNAPMKDSGIEWLGEVPEHWAVHKLGYAARLQGGFAFPADSFGAEGTAVIRMNNLKRGELDLGDAARIPESCCIEKVALHAGDLLWGMSGSIGATGSLGNYARVGENDLPCQLNQRVGRFVANPAVLDIDYWESLIQSPTFYDQVVLAVTGTAQFNISSEQVEACLIALPPRAEQSRIAAFLLEQDTKGRTLTAQSEYAIILLQERRSALISAAVTGQIDVRNYASEGAAA